MLTVTAIAPAALMRDMPDGAATGNLARRTNEEVRARSAGEQRQLRVINVHIIDRAAEQLIERMGELRQRVCPQRRTQIRNAAVP